MVNSKNVYVCFLFFASLVFFTTPSIRAQNIGSEKSVNADPAYTIIPLPKKPAPAEALPLGDALAELDATLIWDTFSKSGLISSGSHHAIFTVSKRGDNAPVLYDNNTIFDLPSPWLNEAGSLYFPSEFVAALSSTIQESVQKDASRFRIAAIIIDPGHGGKDAGASGTHTIKGQKVKAQEKDITLTVSKQLFSKLQKNFPDKRLIMTRTGDTYPTLEDRVTKAHAVPLKENEAIIYISIHANASFNKNARGYEVWYLSPETRRDVIDKNKTNALSEVVSIYNDLLEEQFTTESVLLSQAISQEIGKAFGKEIPSRGIKAEDWYVVKKARMPSVLVELGFVTNTEDTILMLDKSEKFAAAIYSGILNFVKRFESSGGFTEVAAQ